MFQLTFPACRPHRLLDTCNLPVHFYRRRPEAAKTNRGFGITVGADSASVGLSGARAVTRMTPVIARVTDVIPPSEEYQPYSNGGPIKPRKAPPAGFL